jgi:aspartyl-tRNA(Asn)/glutamyl-tRNA(Gln) amidotransferase subunit C
MPLSADEIRWVSHLARLEFVPDELALFTEQLSKVVDYVNQLQAVNTEGVEPLSHPLPIQNVFRPDEVQPSLPVDAALANAPKRQGDFYAVPAVMD